MAGRRPAILDASKKISPNKILWFTVRTHREHL